MKHLIRKIELLGTVSMLSLGLNAATVTVGKSGAAYTTIQAGINAALAGDTVSVAAGTYVEVVNVNKSITLSGAAGAIISGAGLTPPSGDAPLVTIGASNVILQGFEIANYATTSSGSVPAGVWILSPLAHVTVQNNKVHNITTSEANSNYNAHGIACYGRSSTATTDINIIGNEVYSCKLGQSETVVINGNVDGFVIANTNIHDNDNIGIDVIGYEGNGPTLATDTARNGWIYGNTVKNISDNANKSYPANDTSADGIYVDGGNHILIERNIVDNCDIGIECASEHYYWGAATSGPTVPGTQFVTVRNNFVSRSGWTNFAMGGYAPKGTVVSGGGGGGGQATNIVVVNNTSYLGAAAEVIVQYSTTTALIANNIFFAGAGLPYISQAGSGNTGITVQNNMYYGASTTSSGDFADSAPRFANPLLVNTYLDMHLQSTSPAINAGAALGSSVSGSLPVADTWATNAGLLISAAMSGDLDIGGEARVQGGAIEIGADEFGSVQVVAVSLSPTSAALATGATQQFTATVTGTTNTAVTWTATGGTVSTSGLYTAPTTAGTFSVTATSVADTTRSASASVTVTAPVVAVSISPTTASLATGVTQQFTATVTGTTNTAVTWTATGGSVSASGLYTAPATAGTYTVKVTSAADTTKSASATVTVTANVVAVSISPTTAALATGATQPFTATVTGSTNTTVTWTTTGGTVSASGLYTAPATAGTYTVKATSAADTTKSASATVTVTAVTSTFTIGYTTLFTSTDNGNANVLKAMKVTLSQAATIKSLSMYVGTVGGQLTLGIYTDASGSPGTLVATTASFTPVAGWNTAVTTASPSLAAGTYWLVFETNNNTQAQRYQTGTVAIKYRAFTYAAMPGSFGTATTDWSVNYSLYATLQ